MTNKDIKAQIENEMQSVKNMYAKIQEQQEALIKEQQKEIAEYKNCMKELSNMLRDAQIRVHDTQDRAYDILTFKKDISETKKNVADLDKRIRDFEIKMHDVQDRVDNILDQKNILKKITERDQDIQIRIKDVQKQIRNSIFQEKTFDSQNKLLLWSIYKNADQSYDEAKKQFFSDLPKAQGMMKVKHGILLRILDELNAVCKAENIPYWLDFGSMLGAVRQNGFISWDDDIDLGMMRPDLKRLMAALEKNENIKLWNMYAIDHVNTCNLFRVFFKKYDCPCFVDIFVHDYCDNLDESNWDLYLDRRRKLVAKTKIYRNNPDEITEYSSEPDAMTRKAIVDPVRIEQIALEFDKTIVELKERIGWSQEKMEGIIWGIDNFTLTKTRRLFKQDRIFPLREISFEGRHLLIPNQSEELLYEYYGDIYTLPNDMLAHEHIILTEKQKNNLIDIYEKECNQLNEQET